MHRREAVKNVAFLIGASLSATTLAAIFEGCGDRAATTAGSLFTEAELKLITEIADVILPTTQNSPGAKAAGVAPFIPMMLADCYPEDAQKEFQKGVKDVDERSKKAFSKEFLALDTEQRIKIIEDIRLQTIADMDTEKKLKEAAEKDAELKKTTEKERPGSEKAKGEQPKNRSYFFAMARDLTILGFFTSETGVTKAYDYVAIPGRYDGCVDLKPGQKLMA